MNISIYHYGDLPMLKECIEAIDIDVPIYVLDGRYCNFAPEDPPLTEGSREWCNARDRVQYHSPSEDRLPFGHDYPDGLERPGVQAKAEWANYEVLPDFEWTLRLDTDEEVQFDPEIVDDLDPEVKYEPLFIDDSMRYGCQPRLYVPFYWTFWINDSSYPRDELPRDADKADIEKICRNDGNDTQFEELYEHFRIRNFGIDRPDEYINKRCDHLRTMGREDRAMQLDLINKRKGLENE